MKRPDRRIQRTRDALGTALIDLIKEEGYARVTIKDITERANIAYATFFRHFESKEALLLYCMTEIIRELEGTTVTESASDLRMEGQSIFEHVQANHKLYSSLLNIEASRNVLNQLKQIIIENVQSNLLTSSDNQAWIPDDIRANHIAASVLELIAWWLEHNMPYDIEQMAKIYEHVIIKSRL